MLDETSKGKSWLLELPQEGRTSWIADLKASLWCQILAPIPSLIFYREKYFSSDLSFTPGCKTTKGGRHPHSLPEEGRDLGYLKNEEEFSEMSRKPQVSSATTGSPVLGKGKLSLSILGS